MTVPDDDIRPLLSLDQHRSILILRLSALGDVIHTIPAVVALQHALPESEIGWVVEGAYRDLVRTVTGVETIPVSMKKWGRAFVSSRGEMFAARVSVDPSLHIVEQNVALARAVAPAIIEVPNVDFTPFAADPTGKLRELHDRVVLVPGAGRPEKQWPLDCFAEVARQMGDRVIAVWGPNEASLAATIGCEVAPATNLRELAWLLRHARLVIAGDTGPLHLAAALGTPVVGLFGPTDPRRNGPFGQLLNVVETWSSTKSMLSVTAADVLRRIDEVLA